MVPRALGAHRCVGMVESLAQHPGTAGVALHVTGLLGDLGQSVAGGAVEAAVPGEGGYTGGVDVSALAVVATIEGGDASFEGHFDPLGGFHGGGHSQGSKNIHLDCPADPLPNKTKTQTKTNT